MVTASHNPEQVSYVDFEMPHYAKNTYCILGMLPGEKKLQDNGVKLVDPRGEMLEASWEASATLLANAVTPEALVDSLTALISTHQIDSREPSVVVYGHDTRTSCPTLIASLEDGLACWKGKTISAGLVTTPQLHYLVRAINTKDGPNPYGEPSESGYYNKLAKAFSTLSKGRTPLSLMQVDCANGVGAPKLGALLKTIGDGKVNMKVVKDDTKTPGLLNSQCGADFVKTQQKAPPGISLTPGGRYCSLDGDADRIVFYYGADDGTFKLLDGDKIAGLAATFLLELGKQAGLELEVGVVQTAYANGSSTAYLEKILVCHTAMLIWKTSLSLEPKRVPVSCVPTGVKYLHHAAERYDIGVYFEANGHGTILFSPEAIHQISSATPSTPAQQTAILNLHALSELINQTVGDALSDLLFVEIILLHRGWGPKEWDAAYTDLPNRLVKVLVQDRNIFTTTDAERNLVTPQGLQAKVEAIVAKYPKGRSFVRPSGTEDCVRVYAEAAGKTEADGQHSRKRSRVMC